MNIDFRAAAADATVKRLGNVSGVNLASMGDSGLVAVPGGGRRYQFWQAVLLNALIFGCMLLVLAIFPAIFPIAFIGLHIFVSVIQAYIFTVLPAIYLGIATADEH